MAALFSDFCESVTTHQEPESLSACTLDRPQDQHFKIDL